MTTSTGATTTSSAPTRIHVELLSKEKTRKKEEVTPAKMMKNSEESSSEEDEEEEEEDEDEDVGDEAESEYVASNDRKGKQKNKKHLRVDIEPIVLAPAPGEMIDEAPTFAKHHRGLTRTGGVKTEMGKRFGNESSKCKIK